MPKKEDAKISLKIKREEGNAEVVYAPPLGLIHLDDNGEIVITVDAKDESQVREAFKGNKKYSVRKV